MCYIYETKTVGSSRKSKWCESCGKTMNIGESSITVTYFCGEFSNVDVCSDECLSDFEASFEEEYNDDDE